MNSKGKIGSQVAVAIDLFQRGQFDQAEKASQKILNQDRTEVNALVMLGLIAKERQDVATALSWFDRAVESNSKDPTVWFTRGALHYDMGSLGKATADLGKAIEVQPSYVRAYNLYGSALYIANRFEEASVVFRRELELSPRNFGALSNLADCCVRMEENAKAEQILNGLFEYGFKKGAVALKLAQAYISISNQERALEFAKIALAETPDSVEAAVLAFRLTMELVDVQQALPFVESFAKGPSAKPVALLHYLEGLWRAGRACEANQQFPRLLEVCKLAPESVYADYINKSRKDDLGVEYLDALFTNVIAEDLASSPESIEDVRRKLKIEAKSMAPLVTARESTERANFIYRKACPALIEAGHFLRSQSEQVDWPPPAIEKKRVAFIIRTPSYLAHTVSLLNYLRGHSKLETSSIRPIVYITQKYKPSTQLVQEIDKLGIPVRWSNINDVALPERLRGMSMEDKIDAAVFISTFPGLCTIAGFQIARRHIWWAMKYHNVESPDIDGYLTYGSLDKFREINGREWRSIRPYIGDLYDETASSEAERIKKNYAALGAYTILGCIGREEKINNERYIEAVAQIMGGDTGIHYIWTGRNSKDSRDVMQLMAKYGIEDRCHFLGWINTKVYAQVLDIYVDSFPFASGHTAYESMAAGCPLVVALTPESIETSTATLIAPLLQESLSPTEDQTICRRLFSDNNDDLCYSPLVESTEEYVALAKRLISEAGYRHKFGQVGRKFVEQYLVNDERTAESVNDHIEEIIASPNTTTS